MHSVFIIALQSDKGRELTRIHSDSLDAQSVFRELVQFYTTATLGRDKQIEILKYITSTKLGDGTWNGSTHAFILHFQDQMR